MTMPFKVFVVTAVTTSLLFFQPCVIRIEDVFETPEVLYIVLELYHSFVYDVFDIIYVNFKCTLRPCSNDSLWSTFVRNVNTH